MKKLTLLMSAFFVVLLTVNTFGQKLRAIDKSPMDMAYYPDNFAHDRKGDDKAIVRVIYSRPAKNDREIFGKLELFNKVWRTGANENTEIKFYKDVKIEGKNIKAGTYSLFTIPNSTEWTIILNSEVDRWGAYSYNSKSDVLRVKAPVKKSDDVVENFTIQFSKKNEKEATMKLAWDTTLVEISFSF